MRRRKGAVDDSELQESLLQDSEPSDAAVQPAQYEQQLIRYQPFSVDAFIQWVVQSWLTFLSTLSTYLQALLRGGGSVKLSLIQAERLEDLQERLSVPYDGLNPHHQQQLSDLWVVAFPDTPCTNLKANKWKDMGWQSDDPGRDFRGAGLFGLDNLLYLGTHHPQLFRQLMYKTQGERSDWEYPFAVAGLNLTFQVAEVLGVHNNSPGQLPTTAAGRAFCELLRDSEAAFEEVYCLAFALLDRVWLRRRATYMDFNTVMHEVKAQLDSALRKRPTTIKDLEQLLLQNS